MDFKADLLAVIGGELSEFAEGAADLFEGFLGRDFFGEAVGADLHAGGADVVREEDVFLRGFDVVAQFGLVGGVVIEGAAEAHQLDFGIGEAPFHVGALGFAQRNLDAVRMGGAQFDTLKPGRLEILDDGGNVPIFRKIVGDAAKLHFGVLAGRTLGSGGKRVRKKGNGR